MDPATHSRCTFGGMIGNNSCGTHSIMGGKTGPKESGQSGTASPEPVLVTRPPANSSTAVAVAVATARRCSPAPGDAAID